MKINQLKSGVVLSYATQIIHILSGLVYTPIMLRLVGQSEYGLYQLVASVVSYLSLLNLGFGSSYMRFYSRYKVNNDVEGIAKLNGMFMTIFGIISLICLLCGSVMIVNIEAIFGDGLTAAELAKARVLMAMMVFNLALSLITSVYSSNIIASECFFFQRSVELLRALFNPFLTLPLLILGYGSIGMVSVSTFLGIFGFVANMWFCNKKLKIRFDFKNFDFSLLKEMWVFTVFIFINMIVDQINWSVDKFLLGRIMGTSAVAVYGVAGQLNSLYTSLSTTVSGVFVPRVNMLVTKEKDNLKLSELFTKVGRIQFIILCLVITGYILFGKEFIVLWAGEEYETSYRIGLFLMIPVTVPLIQNLGVEIQRAKNMHKARSIVYLFVAISNIFVSIPCIKQWGTEGAAIGTAISLTVGNILFMNFYYQRKIGLDMVYFWKEIGKFIPAVAASVAVGVLVKCFIDTSKITFLVISILIYSVAYAVFMWCIGMNKNEKDLFVVPLKKILHLKEH